MHQPSRNLSGFDTLIDRERLFLENNPDVLNKEPFIINGLSVIMIRETLEVKRRWWEGLFLISKPKKVLNPRWAGLQKGTLYFDEDRVFCCPMTFVRIKAAQARARKKNKT